MNHVWIDQVGRIRSPSPLDELLASEQAAHALQRALGDLAAFADHLALLPDEGDVVH